eukprot:6661214-Karenia_brevis.AAC.1
MFFIQCVKNGRAARERMRDLNPDFVSKYDDMDTDEEVAERLKERNEKAELLKKHKEDQKEEKKRELERMLAMAAIDDDQLKKYMARAEEKRSEPSSSTFNFKALLFNPDPRAEPEVSGEASEEEEAEEEE